jgi:hypothetical protein
LTYRLQAPDKKATVRFTVDVSVGRAPPMLAAKTGRKKVNRMKRMLLEDGLKEMKG